MSLQSIIVLASVLLPFIGVVNMENGAFGNSIGLDGYPNGVSFVYGVYAFLVMVGFMAARLFKGAVPIARPQDFKAAPPFDVFAFCLGWIFFIILLTKLFVFGGWAVWHGQIGKGEFRANLGSYGALAYLLINAVVPMLMAYAAILYRAKKCGWREHGWLGLLIGLTLAIGSTWGFKSTGITMLIPALIVLFWGAAFGRILLLCCVIAITMVVFFYVFDSQTDEATTGLPFLAIRLTTLQGDVSWFLWDEYLQGATFPAYMQTLSVFVGDRLFAWLTGITRENLGLWVDYHFDILIGSLVGLPLSVVSKGHSIVGTPFSDGLILGGVPGVVVMALFVGGFSGVLCTFIDYFLQKGQNFLSALFVTYFGVYVVTFLRNGVLVQLFHVGTIIGLIVASTICMVLVKILIKFGQSKMV